MRLTNFMTENDGLHLDVVAELCDPIGPDGAPPADGLAPGAAVGISIVGEGIFSVDISREEVNGVTLPLRVLGLES